MKSLIFLLSFYLLSLSFITCNDEGSICNKLKTELQLGEDSDSHTHSVPKESDSCSPFCFCDCCQMIITPIELTSIELSIDVFFENKISTFCNDTTQEVLSSLYHPPIVTV